MPGRNIYKDYIPESYYHVYNRGVNGLHIFRDDKDYVVFLGLLKRYLSIEGAKDANGVLYPSYRNQVELLAFCLMPSHFHLLIYQKDAEGMKLLVRSLGIAYGMYANKRYRRRGPLFQQRYKASRVSNESYLLHISRYIHLNPEQYLSWSWSSLPYYTGKFEADWIKPDRILELFEGDNYKKFLENYKTPDEELELVESALAHS